MKYSTMQTIKAALINHTEYLRYQLSLPVEDRVDMLSDRQIQKLLQRQYAAEQDLHANYQVDEE